MICQFCKASFDSADKATIADSREFDTIEIQTKCPCCSEVYYTYALAAQFVPLRHARALIVAASKKQGRKRA